MGNPFHLNDQICRELKWYGCEKYQLSLDGLRETHDWFRKPGSFDCTLEKIGCINRAGIRSVIMTTVSKQNRMEVPGIIDAVVKAGANIFAFSRYVPSGGELDTSMTAQEYRQLLQMCDQNFSKCSRCKLLAWCRGCPAVAKGTNGSFYADAPSAGQVRKTDC